jgi:hypothetical protein
MNTTSSVTTQRQIRVYFWEIHPQFKRRAGWTQNQYPTDVRVAFCDFVEMLSRGEEISDALAQRATL